MELYLRAELKDFLKIIALNYETEIVVWMYKVTVRKRYLKSLLKWNVYVLWVAGHERRDFSQLQTCLRGE